MWTPLTYQYQMFGGAGKLKHVANDRCTLGLQWYCHCVAIRFFHDIAQWPCGFWALKRGALGTLLPQVCVEYSGPLLPRVLRPLPHRQGRAMPWDTEGGARFYWLQGHAERTYCGHLVSVCAHRYPDVKATSMRAYLERTPDLQAAAWNID